MIRADLEGHDCQACGEPLANAPKVERVSVIYGEGEFAGRRGVALQVVCSCGVPDLIDLSVELSADPPFCLPDVLAVVRMDSQLSVDAHRAITDGTRGDAA